MVRMTTYEGSATVIADGAEHQVAAQLAIATDDSTKEWSGTVVAHDEAAAWAIYNCNDTKLRTDSREGEFIAVAFNADTAELRVQGSGPAPFGD